MKRPWFSVLSVTVILVAAQTSSALSQSSSVRGAGTSAARPAVGNVDAVAARIAGLVASVENCLNQVKFLVEQLKELQANRPPNNAPPKSLAKFKANMNALQNKIKKINGKIAQKQAKLDNAETDLNRATAKDKRSTSARTKARRDISAMKKNLSKAKGTGLSLERNAKRVAQQAPPRAR